MPNSVARSGGSHLANGNFNPVIWAKKLNNKYYAQCFLPEITNSDYEGEIKNQGATVTIRTRPTVQINDYLVDMDMQYQDIIDEKIDLLIDKAKYFSFKLDDVDAAQSDIKILNELTTDAGYQMKIAMEKEFLATTYLTAGRALSSTAVDASNVINWIIDAEVQLELANAPTEGRFVILSPKTAGFIQKSDMKNVYVTGDSESIARKNLNNGRLGRIGGMDIYVSNNLGFSGSTGYCMAGHKSAVTYASQIVKVENIRLQNKFGDAVRGLNVYGYKTLLADCLVAMPNTTA
jgi:hypothetical protein